MTLRERHAEFQTLVSQHKGILYKVCHAYAHDADDRDDLAQEILTQLWRSFPSFDGRARFSTWMYRVALNVALSHRRRESARQRHVRPAGGEEERLLRIAGDEPTPPEEVQLARQLIAELDPFQRALLLLYLDGYGYAEIANALGISETNVATKLSRLRKSLRQRFEATDGGER
jgi:RNA polymerase sigma factor (sigma-70 family)